MWRLEWLAALVVFTVACERVAPFERDAIETPGLAPPPGVAPALVYERGPADRQDLYVTPAEGGPERRLTDHPAGDMLPRWSRPGASVVFSSDRSGHWQLWEIPAGGGAPRRLRRNAATEWQADPSPDGGRIVFLSNVSGRECLWTMERVTGASRLLVRHGRHSILGNPHWSPDGRRIVFSSNWRLGHQVYVVEVATGEERRLSPLLSGGCEARFHPDGRKVVYVSRGHLEDRSRLVEHDLETGREAALVAWPALNYDPVYSPDGSELAFASNITGEFAVYRQRLSDGRSWRVTFGPGPARSPDYLAFH